MRPSFLGYVYSIVSEGRNSRRESRPLFARELHLVVKLLVALPESAASEGDRVVPPSATYRRAPFQFRREERHVAHQEIPAVVIRILDVVEGCARVYGVADFDSLACEQRGHFSVVGREVEDVIPEVFES